MGQPGRSPGRSWAFRSDHVDTKLTESVRDSEADLSEHREERLVRDVLSFRDQYLNGHLELHVHFAFRVPHRRSNDQRLFLWFLPRTTNPRELEIALMPRPATWILRCLSMFERR